MTKRTEYNQLVSTVNCSLPSKVNKWRRSIQNWLFPSLCCLCGGAGEGGRDLCRACAGDLVPVGTACRRCGVPLPLPGVCGSCQRRPPVYDRVLSVYHYRPPVDALIKRLKFNGDLRLARLLGALMADRLSALPTAAPELIVPVPLHGERLRQRGFNQALELARPIAGRLGVALDWRQVQRCRATQTQSELPAKQRARNVRGAFTVAPALAARHVAVVDDVMTTGHTVSELAATLRRAGVAEISVWVCARAVLRP